MLLYLKLYYLPSSKVPSRAFYGISLDSWLFYSWSWNHLVIKILFPSFRNGLCFIFINQVNTSKTIVIAECTAWILFGPEVDRMNTEFYYYKLILSKFFNIIIRVKIIISNGIVNNWKLLINTVIQTFHPLLFISIVYKLNLVSNMVLCEKHAYTKIVDFLPVLTKNIFSVEIISEFI